MRLCTLALEGYGRFSERVLELAPGLQIIIGPNEQGKSTLRSFIADMLYGQKRSTMHRLYDEGHELRRPWSHPDRYGGRLVYQLDNTDVIEVTRTFDELAETVRVHDRSNARDITGDFEQFGNKEPAFALRHLGLTKDVFLSTATFSHMTLDDLGDKNALAQIREKLLSLADSGEEASSAEEALQWLGDRIAYIGQPSTGVGVEAAVAAHRPLPAGRRRVAELTAEHEAARQLQETLSARDAKRRRLQAEEQELRQRRSARTEELERLEKSERAARLEEAENLTAEIEAATKRCFELNAVREFASEKAAELQRADSRLAEAQAQFERARGEHDELHRQLAVERKRLQADGACAVEDISEEDETRLAELDAAVQRLRERLEETQESRKAAEERLARAEESLEALPDFSLMASDPVDWLTQLTSSFRVAQRSRDDECEKRDALEADRQRCLDALDGPLGVFVGCDDFPSLAREYEFDARLFDERYSQDTSLIERLRADIQDYRERLPGFIHMTCVSGALMLVLLVAAYITGNQAILIPASLSGLGLFWFVGNWIYVRDALKRTNRQLVTFELDMVDPSERTGEGHEIIEEMMSEAHCETLRELEALYDQYREVTIELAAVEQTCDAQRARAQEAEERVGSMFERYQQTFAELGAELESEDCLDEAASLAATRYQEYRDAKLRRRENQEAFEKRSAAEQDLQSKLDVLVEEECKLALRVRAIMRDNGYEEEKNHDSALRAVRSYRIRAAQSREKSGRVHVLEEKTETVDARFFESERERDESEEQLRRLLHDAGVESIEEWKEKADQAQEYQEAREKRTFLEKQRSALLRGQELEALRAQVDAQGNTQGAGGDVEAIKEELAGLNEQIDALHEEAHALHIEIAERAAGARSLNEIEEERAAVEKRITDLDFDLRAASYAMAQIEEVARDKHSRIAPRLASAASAFMSEITAGAYQELIINRDLDISVRIPQTQQLDNDLDHRLSKGTVDQIYLALRIAMVRILSENRESLPMLLDDPFANYDDERLERTIGLLARIAQNHQILVLTCREDVVRAAKLVQAPIIEL